VIEVTTSLTNSSENTLVFWLITKLVRFKTNSFKMIGKNPKKLEKKLIKPNKIKKTEVQKSRDTTLPPDCVILKKIKEFL
jgi:hypothetical protein